MRKVDLLRRDKVTRGFLRVPLIFTLFGLFIFPAPALGAANSSNTGLMKLERELEQLRKRWNIPGLAAGIASSNQIVWTKSFGYRDLASQDPVTSDTLFHLASLTKPFASTVIMQLVEAGQLDLDAPVTNFGITLTAAGPIRVRHLLSHTSEGVPGEVFRYSGNRFAELDRVLRHVTGVSFARLLDDRILKPLNLTNTAPNPYHATAAAEAHRDPDLFRQRTARGYAFGGKTPVDYPKHFVTAAGLVSNAEDVLRFSIALDQGRLLSPETRQLAFTPAKNSKGKDLPGALGWIVQNHRGAKLVWHYGWDRANSSLIIKIPDRHLTFVLLANSEALSRKFDLGQDEKATRSPFAKAFLEFASKL